MEIMKVRIKKSSDRSVWYNNRIGEEFDVVRCTFKDFDYQGIDEDGNRVWFYAEDCEIAGNEKPVEPVKETEKTNEKVIKMSLESARIFYSKYPDGPISDWLLENFTKEELEPKQGFTWEDSFCGDGFYIGTDSQIRHAKGSVCDLAKNIFKTREQAESALAFAQLTHIVAKYNEGKKPLNMGPLSLPTYFFIFPTSSGKLEYAKYMNESEDGPDSVMLKFNRREDAKTSLEANRELWEQYWMTKKHV
jgi:hypothetical protein